VYTDELKNISALIQTSSPDELPTLIDTLPDATKITVRMAIQTEISQQTALGCKLADVFPEFRNLCMVPAEA